MGTVSIRRYTPSQKPLWESFVAAANNGTLFHTRAFLSYHIRRSFNDHSLVFYKGDRVLALFPAAEVRDGEDRRILHSHPGASVGGFVTGRLTYSEADRLLDAFEDHCRAAGIDETFFVPPPTYYMEIPDETVEYCLQWRGYGVAETYISSVIELEEEIESLFDRMSRGAKRTRASYRRLRNEHGIRMDWAGDPEVLYDILVRNKARHGAFPTHSLEELMALRRLLPGRIHALVASAEDQPIGGSVVFFVNPRVALIFYSAMDYAFSHLQPAMLQVMEVARWAKQRGFRRLDYGVSHETKAKSPLTPRPSLIHFKEQCGGRGMMRRAYRKSFGP